MNKFLYKNMDKSRIELLAPAGNLEALEIAVNNGADAVYLGGQKFNARINATNFDIPTIQRAVNYAHLRDCKVYVTINILIKDEEVREALEYVVKLYTIGVDAVIVQDIGLVYLVKKYIPNMAIHLSTQASIYNVSGTINALKMGVERVVLAREMSLEEIRECCKVAEIEVFVHGAMCMCYSGQCQLSRYIGGRSANRGECAQSCRLPYTNDKGETGYWLSPKDMCRLEDIPQLIEAGVSSLKIEGRMKSPAYVGIVVAIYRKYIDKYYNGEFFEIDDKDIKKLRQIYSRGEFSKGNLYEKQNRNILSGATPKHQGMEIGRVVKRIDQNLIEVELNSQLQMGDIIEVRISTTRFEKKKKGVNTTLQKNDIMQKTLMSTHVTYCKKQGNGRYYIGDVKGQIVTGARVYKMISKSLMEEIQNGEDVYKKCVDMYFEITSQGEFSLTVTDGVRYATVIEKASKRTSTKEITREMIENNIIKQMTKLGDTPFVLRNIDVNIHSIEMFISKAQLNEMRRQAISQLIEEIEKIDIVEIDENDEWTVKTYIHDVLTKFESEDSEFSTNLVRDFQFVKQNFDYVFSNVTKGEEDTEIMRLLLSNKESKGKILESKKVLLNNLAYVDEFLKADCEVFAGNGLNVYNRYAKKYVENLGIKLYELSQESMDIPESLMTTEHIIKSKYLIDGKGNKYEVKFNKYKNKSIITNM